MTVRTILFTTVFLAACGGKDDTGQSAIFDGDNDGSPDSEDCDDERADIYPTAPELCDGDDNDCDGNIDEDPSDAAIWHFDGDGDGYGIADPKQQVEACTLPDGYSAYATDCVDDDTAIHPFADEVCDDVDNNCDAHIDTDAIDIIVWYADTDGDGYGDAAAFQSNCDQPSSYVVDDTDCDDTNGQVNPTANETCNGIDDDCDTLDEYCELPFADASVTIVGEAAGDLAGSWIDSGDTNGDLQGDVLIGAAGYTDSATNQGATYLIEGPIIADLGLDEADASYFGNSGGNMTAAVAVGDIDGDAVSEVVVGAGGSSVAYVIWGPVTSSHGLIIAADDIKVTTTDVGNGLAAIGSFDLGDLTGDLKDDLAFGTQYDDEGGADAGAVSFFFGTLFIATMDAKEDEISLSSPFAKWTGSAGERAGAIVENVGNVSGTSNPDFLIGAPGANKAYVMDDAEASGALADVASAILTGPSGTGTAAAASDVNGDGHADLVLGASQAPGGGRAYIVYGPVSGTIDLDKDADVVLSAAAEGDQAGACVAAGDLTGDLVAEVSVGAPGNDATAADAGAVYVLFGDSGLAGTYDLARTDRTYVGEAAGDAAGSRCAIVEDVSDDSVSDLAVGAPNANGGTGTVYILYSGDVY